jgi:hypothetical protein
MGDGMIMTARQFIVAGIAVALASAGQTYVLLVVALT